MEAACTPFPSTFTSFQEYSALLFYHLRNRGIYTYEGRPAFLTIAHSDADVDRTLGIVDDAFAALEASR